VDSANHDTALKYKMCVWCTFAAALPFESECNASNEISFMQAKATLKIDVQSPVHRARRHFGMEFMLLCL